MTEVSTPYPQLSYPDEAFDINTFEPDTDRVSKWRVSHVPWKQIQLAALHKREEFLPGSGYGRNIWNELYKGETVTKLYVALPASVIATHNILISYNGQKMVVLQHAQPDFAQPRRMDRVELMNYYQWMGRN